MIGTPEYMSPEQAEGKETDQRSDIYSLGVILYEMVTGSVPFEGDTPFTIGVKHKSEAPKDPKELNAQIPEDFSNVILKCLEKDKEKRHQSAGEVLTDLGKVEKGIPTKERVVPERKPITSKEITVTFGLKRLFIPALVIVTLVIIAIVIWQLLTKKEVLPSEPSKPSIAVLPFDDLGPQKNQEYFCDGMANSIINALSHIKGLSVRARGSSFAFKGKQQDLKEIGNTLKVNTVLEGTVEEAENRIRLTAQLINVSDESLLWSEQYDQELSNIFDIQDEITQAIVENLRLQLLGEEKIRLTKHHTENVEAFMHYSQATYYLSRRKGEALQKAIEYFNQAITIDPKYALAYVGLADSYNLLNFYEGVGVNETFPKAEEASRKALEIDDKLGEAHNSLAYTKERWHWDWEAARKGFKRAIDLNPNYATAHFWYGEFLVFQGCLDEGILEIEKAAELDPISLIIKTSLGWAYGISGKYKEALAQINNVIEMDPSFANAHWHLGWHHIRMKKFPEAIEAFKIADELFEGLPTVISSLAYALSGEREKAMEFIDKLKTISKERPVDKLLFGAIHGALGEKDLAFEFLERGYEDRNELMVALRVFPGFDPLRSDPRLKTLLKKMNLE